jgi:homocysteine S-methyltransferase
VVRDPFAPLLADGGVAVIDGAMGTELERRGADVRDPLWSAHILLESPDLVREVHAAYVAAGADIAISASYQATFEGLASRGLERDAAAEVLRSSVRIAREAAGGAIVAASVGPYGAYLGNGAEYTGDYDLDEDALVAFHVPRLETLAEAGPDVFAIETIPSVVEARALVRALERVSEVPAWISFSCRDGAHLCDGTPFRPAAEIATGSPSVVAVGINCTAPLHAVSLIELVRSASDRPVVCYPNRGSFWDPMRKTWTDPPRQDMRSPLRPAEWRAAGARLIGGCCGTTPDDIAVMASSLREGRPRV